MEEFQRLLKGQEKIFWKKFDIGVGIFVFL